MAEDDFAEDEVDDEDGDKPKRFIPVSTVEAFETMLADSLPKKAVVVVAWLVPGDKHSTLALRFVKEALKEEPYSLVTVLTVDPSALPQLAQKNSLHAVPTFQYYYKELVYTYIGTNSEKFLVYLAKVVEKRLEEIGQTLYLQRDAPVETTLTVGAKAELELNTFTLGFGWTPQEGEQLNIEVLAFLLNDSDRTPSDGHVVFSGNPTLQPSGCLTYVSQLTRDSPEQDDIVMKVNLDTVEEDVVSVVFVMVILKAEEREQNFEQLVGAYARGFDQEQHKALFMLSLEGVGSGTAMVVGKLTRAEGGASGWDFTAVAEGMDATLEDVFAKYQPPKTAKKKGK